MMITIPVPAEETLEAVISPSGEEAVRTPGTNDQAGQEEGGSGATGEQGIAVSPAGDTSEAGDTSMVTWLTYTDPERGISIKYPDTYTILPETEPFAGIRTQLIHRVRFQDKVLASGPTANLEPPQFTIEVFENPESLDLMDWLDRNVPNGSRAEVSIGSLAGTKVTMQTMMAPNEFYYLAGEREIYGLIPLGSYASEMLPSFKIGS
jgi:hypothetical protein